MCDAQELGVVSQWQDVDFPFIAAGEGFYGNEPFPAFHDVLTCADTTLNGTRISIVNRGLER